MTTRATPNAGVVPKCLLLRFYSFSSLQAGIVITVERSPVENSILHEAALLVINTMAVTSIMESIGKITRWDIFSKIACLAVRIVITLSEIDLKKNS
jgi:hypothetical protein